MPKNQLSTSPSADCIQRAYLYLTRDVDTDGPPYSVEELELMAFDPSDVTRLVGLQPTKAWRRGDLHPGRAGRRRFSNWEFGPASVRTHLTEEVVAALLDVVEPHRADIADACGSLGLRAGVMVVIEMSGNRDTADGSIDVSTAAITYTAETVKRLARLNLSVDHDQYVYLPD
jgi:Domain of unknown function (DUF4279)